MINELRKVIAKLEELPVAKQKELARLIQNELDRDGFTKEHTVSETHETAQKYKTAKTIRLRINQRVYKQLMWLLQHFNKNEIEVIEEDATFQSVKDYLAKELESIEDGSAEFIDIDELENELESTIKRHES